MRYEARMSSDEHGLFRLFYLFKYIRFLYKIQNSSSPGPSLAPWNFQAVTEWSAISHFRGSLTQGSNLCSGAGRRILKPLVSKLRRRLTDMKEFDHIARGRRMDYTWLNTPNSVMAAAALHLQAARKDSHFTAGSR